jgi:hypothetical protein
MTGPSLGGPQTNSTGHFTGALPLAMDSCNGGMMEVMITESQTPIPGRFLIGGAGDARVRALE